MGVPDFLPSSTTSLTASLTTSLTADLSTGLTAALTQVDTLIDLMLAISLSAASGFRVFVPLLVLSAASYLGHVDLPSSFDWVENPQALGLFAIASVLEVLGYAIPWLDHGLDLLATPAAIVAGTLVAASVAPEMDPLVKWTVAIAAGGGSAGLTKGLMNLLRAASTALSGGLTNPVFAAIELGLAIGLSVLALTVPLAAGVGVLGLLGFAVYRLGSAGLALWRKLTRG